MKLSIALAFISSASAFSPQLKGQSQTKVPTETKASSIATEDAKKPLFDPLGLYPKDAPERTDGRIQPLETSESYGTIKDPMNLYKDKSEVDETVAMSVSLPFLKRPEMLDGSLPGDRGFDPFNFSRDEDSLQWYRSAEIKHARIAMLAAAGWPLAELFNKQLAQALDLPSLLQVHGRVPSVLNGGLAKVPPLYWVGVLSAATIIEGVGAFKEREAAQKGEDYTPGDLGFDPLGLYGKTEDNKKFKLEAELFNGRLAMLAITGFAVQEWLSQDSVVNSFPIFFKPMNVALEQLADASAHVM